MISLMTNRSKYEKLDDIGMVGQQVKQSASSRKYHRVKTGEIFRQARAAGKRGSLKRSVTKAPSSR
jgi:hypothetical protein